MLGLAHQSGDFFADGAVGGEDSLPADMETPPSVVVDK